MAKSIKFKDNIYLDSTSIIHKKETIRTPLNILLDKIIESGSNDNGSYVKFDNGIIIEYGRNTFTCDANSYTDITITLPIMTIATVWANITMQSTSSSATMGSITLAINSFNTNSLTIRAFNDTSGGRSPDGFWVVIGKWK